VKRFPARLDVPKAALFASTLLLVAMVAIPFTRAGLFESISVKLGAWHYWIPGYTDGHNWVPNERLPEATGPNAELIDAFLEENGRSGGKYLVSNPRNLRLRALYIRRTLRDKSMSLVNNVDYPYGRSDPEGERKQAQHLAILQAKIPTVLAAAIEGERQEPRNAFFPIAQAIAYESLRDRDSSRKALQRAVKCAYYNDYWYPTWITFKAATEQHIYDRLYDARHGEPELTRELFHFANRLSHESDSEGLKMKGLLLDCLTRIGSQSSTASEFSSVKSAIWAVIPFETLYPDQLGRRSNEGDVFRELTLLQMDLISSGHKLRADLPAFFGTELVSNSTYFDGSHREWDERSFLTLLKYESAVITGTFIIECILGIAVLSAVLFLLSQIKPAGWPHWGIPPLIAFVTSAVTIASDQRLLNSMAFVAACFLLAFVASFFERLPRYSVVLGVIGSLASVAVGVVFFSEYSGSEFIPGIAYALAMMRAMWVSKRLHVRGWIVSTAGVTIVSIGAGSMWPLSFAERATTFVPVAVLFILATCVWYRAHFGDASRRMLRTVPVALLAGVIILLGVTLSHHVIVNEMNWLIGVEADMAAYGRKAASEIGPPK
jgi:hypothetical protein